MLHSDPVTSPPSPHGRNMRMVLRWLHEGLRSALFRQPRWDTVSAHPAAMLALLLTGLLISLALQRLWVDGPAQPEWQALLAGWLAPAATAWVCYALRHNDTHPSGPDTASLFCLLAAQGTVIWSGFALAWTLILQQPADSVLLGPEASWALGMALWLWLGSAHAFTLWRATHRKVWVLPLAATLLGLSIAESGQQNNGFWIAEADATTAHDNPPRLKLTQEIIERQTEILAQRLETLQPQRPGAVDLYALTFAPYADEDVFRRESGLVAEVMARRFDTAGRTLQLVNHAHSVNEWPWATPLNLKRAIFRVAALMDPNEDVLFIHLTSHGAQDGELAAEFWPLTVQAVTPAMLRSWLDQAGIRYRVISISACYSGSWIKPLQHEGSLVMTAADADHTSFGCGRLSELTYFGRAMYDEQLRRHTRSFEAAHAAARPIIDQRERAAGKDDGYSNPQISVGSLIREPLERLRKRLEAPAGRQQG